MPLFRKGSASKGRESDEGAGPAQETKTSLLTRLSRRNSLPDSSNEPAKQTSRSRQSSRHNEHNDKQKLPHRPSSQKSRSNSQDESLGAESHQLLDDHVSSDHAGAQTTNSLASMDPVVASTGDGLLKDDIKNLFFGAPHFMLEKGKHGAAFPQAFFPWNHELEISDLQDRKYLSHETFALATLHAHLPIPDAMDWKPSSLGPQKRGEAWKRPAFDLSIFEIPNMLSIDGRLPGTVGLRYFLEIPLSEAYETAARAEEEQARSSRSVGDMAAFEAFKTLEHSEGNAKVGKHAPHQHRMQLITDGPNSWKRVGVRDIHPSTIAERLSLIGSWHEQVLSDGWQVSVIDKQECATLHKQLFEDFLYPPEKATVYNGHESLKVQIEALVKVLTVPSAWIDFSLVQSRIGLGQVLWEYSTPEDHGASSSMRSSENERHWLLVQLLLSVELVLRLDAALRLGFAKKTKHFQLSGEEIHHFNKLRNAKVDWDLVVARRFLDMVEVKRSSTSLSPKEKRRDSFRSAPPRFLSSFRHSHEQTDTMSVWDCAILPRQAKLQVEGLVRFARLINWPSADQLETRLLSDIELSKSPTELYAAPIASAPDRAGQKLVEKGEWLDKAHVTLQSHRAAQLGSWLSRSWLTGLAIPGEAVSALLMSTLLENDDEALNKLGNSAFLHGGFVLDRRTWWSKFCVVGRVFAPLEGGSECMGWIGTPKLLPVDEKGQEMSNGWIDVSTRPVPNPREGWRIHDGVKLAQQSSPLGIGQGKVMSDEFGMVTDDALNQVQSAKVELGSLSLQEAAPSSQSMGEYEASVAFELEPSDPGQSRSCNLKLLHDVYFIAAHACRLPHGHAIFAASAAHQHPHHKHAEHLPSHPLHQSYKYSFISVHGLGKSPPPNSAQHDNVVWIVEAREDSAKDIYARAWCSQVGVNALVAKSGKTCISCAIREARALEVGLIIWVGGP